MLLLDLPQVNFIKRLLVAGVIRGSSFRENESFYKALLVAAKQQLTSLPPLTKTQLASLTRPKILITNSTGKAETGGTGTQVGKSGPEAENGSSNLYGGQKSDAVVSRPVWKQLRALLVFVILSLLVLHQLYLGSQIYVLQQGRF